MSYEPRSGTVPAKAIAILREGPLTLGVLADRIEQDANTVRSCLMVAIDHGVVSRERNARTGQWVYSIGDGIPLRRHDPGESLPSQRTVAAADSPPGVDIDAIHRSTIWHTAPKPAGLLFTLEHDGRLCIDSPAMKLTLDLEQTQQLRLLLAA